MATQSSLLRELKATLEKAVTDGRLLISDASELPESVSRFLRYMPDRRIAFSDTVLALGQDRLSISGKNAGKTWKMPGLPFLAVSPESLSLTLAQENTSLIPHLGVSGTLDIAGARVQVAGTVDPSGLAQFSVQGDSHDVSMITVAGAAFPSLPEALFPSDASELGALPISTLAFDLGSATWTRLICTSSSREEWKLIDGVLAFHGLRVSLFCQGERRDEKDVITGYGGEIRGRIRLRGLDEIGVRAALAGRNHLELEMVPDDGNVLPGLDALAALAGGEDLRRAVQDGIQRLGLTKISVNGVTLRADLTARSIPSLLLRTGLTLAGISFESKLYLPSFELSGRMVPGQEIPLKELASRYFAGTEFLPEIAVSSLGMGAAPRDGSYFLSASVKSGWSLPVGAFNFGVRELHLDVEKGPSEAGGALTGVLDLAGIEVRLDAALKDRLVLGGTIPSLDLPALAQGFLGGAPLPPELPRVLFSDLDIHLEPASGKVEVKGRAETVWRLGGRELAAGLDLKVSRPGLCTLRLDARGPLEIAEGFALKDFAFDFTLEDGKDWAVSGSATAQLFGRELRLEAGYHQREGHRRLRLFARTDFDLIDFPGIAKLRASEVLLELEKDVEGQFSWNLAAASQLKIDGVLDLAGRLALGKKGDQRKIALTLDPASFTLPLLDSPKVGLTVSAGEILLVHQKAGWSFEAAAALSVTGLPGFLHETLLLPRETAATLRIDGKSVSLTASRVTEPIDFEMPDLELLDGTRLDLSGLRRLGKARAEVTDLSITLSRTPSLTAVFGIGLPARLNEIFGTQNDGSAAVNLFKTLPEMVKVKLGLGFQGGQPGIVFNLESSPFRKLEIQGGVWKCDLGSYGAVDVDAPTFRYGTAGFQASTGFRVVRPLKIPLVPIKQILTRAGLGTMASGLPDSVPLTAVRLLDSNGQLKTDELSSFSLPGEVREILRMLASAINRLPSSLREYLEIQLPESFHLDINVGSGAGVDLTVRSEPAIRLLVPGIASGIPALVGIRLRSFSFGALLGGSLFHLSLDADFEEFNLLSLIAALTPADFLPSADRLERRLQLKNFYTVIVYQAGIPIPVPLFYDQIDLQYRGIEGLALRASAQFPMPRVSVLEILKLIAAARRFFTEPRARLEEKDIPKEMNLVFNLRELELELPAYLSEQRIRTSLEINAGQLIARLLNAVKFASLDDLIQLLPLDSRAGACGIDLRPLRGDMKWLLTTPRELAEGAWKKLGVLPAEAPRFLALLPGAEKESGLAAFFHGRAELGRATGLELSIATLLAGSRGFLASFRTEGRLHETTEIFLEGKMEVVRARSPQEQSYVRAAGASRLRFLGLEVFQGSFDGRAGAGGFQLQGDFQLFTEDCPVNVRGRLEGMVGQQGLDLKGSVTASLGLVVLTQATAAVHPGLVRLEALWLGSRVSFEVKDGPGFFLLDLGSTFLQGVARLDARVEVDKTTRETRIAITGEALGLYGLKVQGTGKAGTLLGQGELTLSAFGRPVLTGKATSGPDQLAFNGSFLLLPVGSPVNVEGQVAGSLRPNAFVLEGSGKAWLGPMVITGAKFELSNQGLALSGSLLGATMALRLAEQGQKIVSTFTFDLGLSFESKLEVAKDGRSGSLALLGKAGALAFDTKLLLSQASCSGEYSLSFLGLKALKGNVTATGSGLELGGELHLAFPGFLELQARAKGSINQGGFSVQAEGSTSSWIPGVPGSTARVSLRPDALTAALTLHFGGLVGDIGAAASYRTWRDRPCLLIAWVAGLSGADKHHLAVSSRGVESLGLAWRTFPGDWPGEAVPSGRTSVAEAPGAAFLASGEDAPPPVPILQLVRGYLEHPWGEQTPLDSPRSITAANLAGVLETAGRWQVEVQALRPEDDPAAPPTVRVVLHSVPEEPTTEIEQDLRSLMTQGEEQASLVFEASPRARRGRSVSLGLLQDGETLADIAGLQASAAYRRVQKELAPSRQRRARKGAR